MYVNKRVNRVNNEYVIFGAINPWGGALAGSVYFSRKARYKFDKERMITNADIKIYCKSNIEKIRR